MLRASFFDAGLVIEPRRSTTPPVLSVVLPVGRRSGGDPVRSASAVLSQDFHDLELVIVDDGSGDDWLEPLLHLRAADDRIAVLRFARRSGLVAHRFNAGIRHAAGTFVSYQLPTDHLLPGGLRALADRAKAEDAAFVHAGCRLFDAGGAEIIVGDTEVRANHLAVRNYVALAGVLHRRDLMLRAGLFDPHLSMTEAFDWDMWRRIATLTKAKLVAGVVAEGRATEPPHPVVADLARTRMSCDRGRELAFDAAPDCDVLGEGSFAANDRLLFHSLCALPYLGARLSLPELRHGIAVSGLMPADVTTISLAGTIRAATVEMAFHNFAATFPETIRVVEYDEHDDAATPLTADVAVNLRSTAPVWNERRRRARAALQPIVYAMDDDLIGPHVGRDDSRGRLDSVTAQLRDADYVIVYAKALREVAAPFNRRSSLLMMNVPTRYLDIPKPARAADGGRAEFLIIARVVRSREMMSIAAELRRFFDEHDSEARLTIFVNDELLDKYRRVLGDLKFDTTPLLKYRDFRDWLVRSSYDFLINPLRDNPFNRGKSAVKFIEATLAGAVLLTSGTGPYKPIRDGETGIKVPWRDDAWYDALKAALAMPPAARAAMRNAAREQLREEYSTESQYLPFRSALEAARVHALLRSRERPDGIPLVLAENAAALTNVLGPFHLRFLAPAGFALTAKTPAERAEALRRASVALVHADSLSSPWIAAANLARIPAVASFHDGPILPAFVRAEAGEPDLVLTASAEGVLALRRARYDFVLQWRPPAGASGESTSAQTSPDVPEGSGTDTLDAAASDYVLAGREVAAANLLRLYRAAIERSILRVGRETIAPQSVGRPRRRVEISTRDPKIEFLGFRSSDPAPMRILEAAYGSGFRATDGDRRPRVLLGSRGPDDGVVFVVEANDLQIGFAAGRNGAKATLRVDGYASEVEVTGETWVPLDRFVNQH